MLGTGIICGLEFKMLSNQNITISKGAAVTSDGDLLEVQKNLTLNRFKVFKDNKAEYKPFLKSDGTQINLWQLYPVTASGLATEGAMPISQFNSGQRIFNKMALVLYLESYLKPPADCTEVDCDNLGPQQKNQMRFLLISKSDLDEIKSLPYFDLPDVKIERVNLHKGTITNLNVLGNRFVEAINNSKNSLITALAATWGEEKGLLRKMLHTIYTSNASEILGQKLSVNNTTQNIQYVHDFMVDLAAAYDEFREALFDLNVDCCPPPTKHPKHILVQEIVKESEDFIPASYRHHFCESTLLNRGDRKVEIILTLHQKLNLMIRQFSVPASSNMAIRITPSVKGKVAFSEKPIPFYYNYSENLRQSWSYTKKVRGKSDSILGYRQAARTDALPEVKNPFQFVDESNNFYRIEGHLGKDKDAVESALNNLKKSHNLSFQITSIQVENAPRFIGRIKPPRAYFPTITGLLHHYREGLYSQLGLVKKFNQEFEGKAKTEIDSDKSDFDTDQKDILNNARKSANELNNTLDSIQGRMLKSGSNSEKKEFKKTKAFFGSEDYKEFKKSYKIAVQNSYNINSKVFDYAQAKMNNPTHMMVQDGLLDRFDRLKKLFEKNLNRLKKQYIFDTFFNHNPGLEHLSGVVQGGTLVLVYSVNDASNTETVIADFSLPGSYLVEVEGEVDIETPPLVHPPEFKWIDKLGLYKDLKLKNSFEKRLGNLESQTINKGNFFDELLPQILVFQGGASTGGKIDAFDTFGGIREKETRTIMEGLRSKKESIKYLESRGSSRTPEEDAKLKRLIKSYDSDASLLMNNMGDKSGDIDPQGDEIKVLEMLNNFNKEMSSDTRGKMESTKSTTETLAGSTGNKIILGGMLGRFEF